MGSLNGDIMVMRNGRSTSQVSVYNYPEHLNPFYEDDQHKRLRFWKISKKDNDGRRNSFSIANLKDMWAFKSFRMKKKSSTLGINKTSESPPLLRRDYVLDNGWNTFDNRLRASNTSSINGDNFQRNATYRSSLQTLPTNNNDRIGLNRNDGYRSTIQVPRSNTRYQPQQKHHLPSNLGVSPNRRYVYGGSVTPQPLRNSRSNIGRGPYEYDSDNAMLRGSSQSSMVSTNPFESDDEETEEFKAGMRSILNGSITTLTSRTPRKKRRAPAPPTPIHGNSNGVALPTIRIDSSHDNTQDELLHIKEDMDIANLTAEIESFVKTKSHDDDVEESAQNKSHTTTTTASDNNINAEHLQVEAEERQPTNVIITPKTTTITEDITLIPKETIHDKESNEPEKVTNGQVTTIESVSTAEIDAHNNEPQENATKLLSVSSEIETNIEDSNKEEVKANGAIPKKPNNNQQQQQQLKQTNENVTELCIRETCTDETPAKPIPLKRQMKTDTEVGQVECIHVHVESPKASPRSKDHSNALTSFKTSVETIESNDTITTKTPFVLTSPPSQKRTPQPMDSKTEPIKKETVKIIDASNTKTKLSHDLSIQEECRPIKPEILVKPTLSPKPVTKEINGKLHTYADIHKPARRHHQNGQQSAKALREGSVSPPCVPTYVPTIIEEEKINNTDQFLRHGDNGRMEEEKPTAVKQLQFDHLDNLKIVESKTATVKRSRGELKIEDEEELANSSSVAVSLAEETKRDDEFDALYRSKPTSHMEWKRSTLAPLETHIPPEKRKSVKDIIESINRSQRLLNAAANKDFPALQNPKYLNNNNNNNNLNDDLKILNRQLQEEQQQQLAGAANSPSPSPSNDYNDNNNEIFQKCKVNKEVFDYRETSPITSNLDWNPVPKPKRTKSAQE